MMNHFSHMFSGTYMQVLATITAAFVAFSDGMNYGWTAPVIPILLSNNSHIVTNLSECEWLEYIPSFGAFAGLPITIYLVDKIGRKKAILVATVMSLLCWIGIASADKMVYLYGIRFFCGVAGDMAFVGGPMYIAEIADEKIRGFLASLIYLMMLIGILAVYSVVPYVPFIVPSIIAGSFLTIELIIFPFMPESPYFLLICKKQEQARKSLTIMRPGRSDEDIDKELEDISIAVQKQSRQKARPKDLVLVESNRKALLIMLILNGAQHFSSISVMIMNLHLILGAAESIYIENSLAAILFAAIMLVAATITSFTVDKYGRKMLLTASSILSGLCLLVIAIYFTMQNYGVDVKAVSWLPIAAVILYAVTFKLGLGMVPIILTAELFPANVKALGMTISDGAYVIFSFVSVEIYQILSANFGIHAPFFLFSVSCFVTALFTIFVIPETKGKTLDEIQSILKKEKCISKEMDLENDKK